METTITRAFLILGIKTFASIQAMHKGFITTSMLITLENRHPGFLPDYNCLRIIYKHALVFEVSLNSNKIVSTRKIILLSKQDCSCVIWKLLIGFDWYHLLYQCWKGPIKSRPSCKDIAPGNNLLRTV